MSQKNELLDQRAQFADASDGGEIEIDLVELMYRLIERIRYIIAAAILGAVLAGLFTTLFIKPKYTSTSKLYVLNSKDSAINLSDLQIGNYLASDYTEVFKNRHVHQRVIDNLGLSYTTRQISGMVSISNPSDTRILYINVTSTSPEEAQSMANEYAKVAREFIAATMDTAQPNVFEEAWLPTAPSSPNRLRNIILGGMLGGLVACIIIFIQFLQDDKIRTAGDIQKYVELPTLGMMPLRGSKSSQAKPIYGSHAKK